MTITILIFLASLFMLYFGAELALNASEKIGLALGLSPLVVGMLLVGIGTSLPELFVSHIAATDARFDFALGGLVGSNIANTFLILGIATLLMPLNLAGKNTRNQLFTHLLLCLSLLYIFSKTHWDLINSLILISILLLYLILIYKEIRSSREQEVEKINSKQWPMLIIKTILGFFILYQGGVFLVDSGKEIGLALGISEYILSAIFVAVGTSLPELITSLLIIIRGQSTDMIIGNIIGSNMFNLGLILVSLFPYNPVYQGGNSQEAYSLIFAAALLLILSWLSKSLYRFFGMFFLLNYLRIVAHWLNY